MEDQDDAERAIASLHRIISQSETGLQLMRAEVNRLEKLIEDPELQAVASGNRIALQPAERDP